MYLLNFVLSLSKKVISVFVRLTLPMLFLENDCACYANSKLLVLLKKMLSLRPQRVMQMGVKYQVNFALSV